MRTRSLGICPELISKLCVKIISLLPCCSLKRVRFRVRFLSCFRVTRIFLRLPVVVPIPWM